MRLRLPAPVVLLPAAVLLAADSVAAQPDSGAAPPTALGVPIGTRVQVRSPGGLRAEGTLAGVRGDTLVLRTSADTTDPVTRIALADVRRLAVSGGRRTRGEAVTRGALQGFALGVGAATALYVLTAATDRQSLNDPVGLGMLGLVSFGTTFGLTVRGAVLGYRQPGERWRGVPLPPRSRAAVTAAPGGATLALRVTF